MSYAVIEARPSGACWPLSYFDYESDGRLYNSAQDKCAPFLLPGYELNTRQKDTWFIYSKLHIEAAWYRPDSRFFHRWAHYTIAVIGAVPVLGWIASRVERFVAEKVFGFAEQNAGEVSEGPTVDRYLRNNWEAFKQACEERMLDLRLKRLGGIDPALYPNRGYDLILNAIFRKQNVERIKGLLLSRVALQHNSGKSDLIHWAYMDTDQERRKVIVDLLITHGFDLTCKSNSCGDTPLHYAMRTLDTELIQRLFGKHGTQKPHLAEIKNDLGWTPYHWLCAQMNLNFHEEDRSDEDKAWYEKAYEIELLFLNSGADLLIQTPQGKTGKDLRDEGFNV